MPKLTKRQPGHPLHAQWLEDNKVWNRRSRRKAMGLPEDAEVPQGRPVKPRHTCPLCGDEHIIRKEVRR